MHSNRFIDLTGKNVGILKVIKISTKIGKRQESYWECICSCGKQLNIRGDLLRRNKQKSCGCLSKIDLTNKKFNLLFVICYSGKRSKTRSFNGEKIWKCKCDCGKITYIGTSALTRSKIKSCGCLRNRKQGGNPNWKGFEDISSVFWYGITTAAKNRKFDFAISIEYAWNLFLKQNKKCALTGVDIIFNKNHNERNTRTASLDRIDNSKGYIEGNVQWVHKDVNRMKWAYSQDYFIDICCKVADNIRNKNNTVL